MEQYLRHQQAKRITLASVAVNIGLAAIKIICGITGHSQALIADGIHSASDLLTDVLVLIAAKYGSQHADKEHPYGHQRIETVATVALAVLLILTGALIIFDTVHDLLHQQHSQPTPLVFWIALLSAIANEALFYITKKIGRKINSNLLIANAWHHRSDAASSLIVAAGIAGALWGYLYLDTIAALIVGILIIKMGFDLSWGNIRELIDTGLDETMIDKIKNIIFSVAGVKAIHQLRSRKMGSSVLLDLHIQVKPFLSVSEGHYIAQQVHFTLMQQMPEIVDVTIHIDPEDDEVAAPSKFLPDQKKIIQLLRQRWAELPESNAIEKIILHYLSGKITVEVKLPLTILEQGKTARQILNEFQTRIADIEAIEQIELWFGGSNY